MDVDSMIAAGCDAVRSRVEAVKASGTYVPSIPGEARRMMMAVGRGLWAATYGKHPKGTTTRGNVTAVVVATYHQRGYPLDPVEGSMLVTAAQWCDSGLPSVAVEGKFAASMMSTTLPPSMADAVAVPWPCFEITLPPDSLLVSNPFGAAECVESVFVATVDATSSATGKPGYLVALTGSAATNVVSCVMSLADMAAKAEDGDVWEDSPIELDGLDERALVLACRLALGVMVTLDSSQHRHRIEFGSNPPRGGRMKRGRPTSWSFRLTGNVRVDCRPWVQAFLRGDKGTRKSVQSLVRGHHKRQSFGPGNSQRKWIHVEPYWRGPEDAPIALRQHELRSP